MRCEILLATYNGARFIRDQLDSLLAQSVGDFRLLVRDDGSRDETRDILAEYAPRFGDRMAVIEEGAPTGGPTGNFHILMNASAARHVLLCDQDDVWLPNRVEETLAMLARCEAETGAETPAYVFTDLHPVNAALEPIARSYWDYKKIDPKMARSLPQSLLTCPVLGCASGLNRPLIELCRAMSPKAVAHDWWALQVAIMFGTVAWSPERTVRYRLHGGNVSAQKRTSLRGFLQRESPFRVVRDGLRKKAGNAEALLEVYGDRLPPQARRTLERFVAIPGQTSLRRKFELARGGYLYGDFRRNLALLAAA